MGNSNNSRWWETYLVRYITGSVVGAVIVYIILKKFKIDLIPCFDEIQSTNLVVLALLGFLYCYLASAPITLLHATRGLFGKSGGLKISNRIFIEMMVLTCLVSALLALFTYPELWVFSFFSGLILFNLYFHSINLLAKVDQQKEWQTWYATLAISRKNGSKEFIESYRHLREHGNAFFIVLMEVALAIPLYMIASIPWQSEAKVALVLFAITIWLIPGMICWFLGNLLEQYLIDTEALQIEQHEQNEPQYRPSIERINRIKR